MKYHKSFFVTEFLLGLLLILIIKYNPLKNRRMNFYYFCRLSKTLYKRLKIFTLDIIIFTLLIAAYLD